MAVRLVSHEEPLPGYRLIERLGRGGFGEVWKCEAPGGLHKAIKFVFGDLDASDDESTRAAEQELKALERVKKIRHPYILSLEQYRIVDGQLMIVMELADKNLWDRFRECRGLGMPGVPREELLKYMDECAEALDVMNNDYNIQHLDVKPQNIFLVHNHVKVADFGLAKMFEGVRGTVTGGVTPVYAAPETFEGYVSRFTDQYSLAIVFQELLTGTRPFNGSNTKQLLMQHLNGLPDLDPLPAGDRPVIDRGLAKKPEHRFPSCTEMVKALRAAGSASAVGATPAPMDLAAIVVTRTTNLLGRDTPLPPPLSPSLRPPSSDLMPRLVPPSSSGTSFLVTPRLVTPLGASGGLGPANTLTQNAVVQTARMSALGLAAPERTEGGVLRPALFVAVGRTGAMLLAALKAVLRDRFGALDAVPHFRFLTIDTDAAQPEGAVEAETVIVRLNRPHHYLARDGQTSVEPWLPAGLLYKLPRNPEAANGVRAFGRLALIDNYRTVAQRIRQQVEAFVGDEEHDAAAASTGQGVRTNRARVYLFAGLAGGTGSGMFLDLAYIIKHELRQIGYKSPEVHGILAVPPADKAAPRGLALANTYAALRELAHFQNGRNRYSVRFEPKEAAITESASPFTRCAVVQLPKHARPADQDELAGLVARQVFLELCTPAGRNIDEIRCEADVLNKAKTPVVAAFGLARLTFPRREVLTAASRRLAQKLIKRWTSKESGHLREPIEAWLGEQWGERGLEMEAVVARFDAVIAETLNEEPDRVFDAFVNPLIGTGRLEPSTVVAVLGQVLSIVGKPPTENDKPGTLAEVLAGKYKEFAKEAEGQFSALTVALIEQTQYRLPGAEEALNQLEERLHRTIDGLAGVRTTLDRDVREAYARLFPLIGGLANPTGFATRKTAITGELLEMLRQYPRRRLKLLVLDATLDLYRAMLACVPDYLREVTFCRNHLDGIAAAVGTVAASPGRGRMILPEGVESVEATAEQFLSMLPAQDLIAFDQAVQKEALRKFRGVANVCLKQKHTEAFQAMLVKEARGFLDARLERSDPAAMFFRHRQPGPASAELIAQVFADAAPGLAGLTGKPLMESTILACPAGPDGEKFRQLVADALPDVGFIPATLPDDIAFLRELPLLPLAELPQLGPFAREAYESQLRLDQPPHTRGDVAWAAEG